MTDRQLVYGLFEFNFVKLCELANEFQVPKTEIANFSSHVIETILEWCDRQGQREHLRARVQEILFDDPT